MTNPKTPRHVRFENAIQALLQPRNEPINWLFGETLRKQVKTSKSHFLLELLDKPPTHVLASWNWWISEFRGSLINPEVAPQKATIDLKTEKEDDAEGKLRSFVAEIFAVLHLKKLGYTKFKILLPGSLPMPDFTAQYQNQNAKIEVKNLREPEDIVRTVATRHWKERRKADPDRYNFRAILRHSHRGSMSAAAIQRLKSILDLLPETKKNPLVEVLDGGVKVQIEKLSADPLERSTIEDIVLDEMAITGDSPGQLIVKSAIRREDLDFDLSGLQSLFLKALRRVVEATPKFFGETLSHNVLNVIALYWEPPDLLIDSQTTAYTEEKIKKLFEEFNLRLELIIFFQPPEVPIAVLRGK